MEWFGNAPAKRNGSDNVTQICICTNTVTDARSPQTADHSNSKRNWAGRV